MFDDTIQFEEKCKLNIAKMTSGESTEAKDSAMNFMETTEKYKYSYNFKWLGRPILQYPQDIIAMQEIIWETKPDLIIETGIARGGSIVFYSSILELLNNNGKVIGIDIDIREHNKLAIESHPLYKNVKLIEGSSTEECTLDEVKNFINENNLKKIMVVLDSNHTHTHVLKELRTYSPLVTKGNYMVVFDTAIEDSSQANCEDRPWGKGNNPKTAVWEFLKETDRFTIDKSVEDKLLITVAPSGYLLCIK